ncbi:hypothetical protein HK098_007344, partial [Nowakowskiella sp. JEL0407]
DAFALSRNDQRYQLDLSENYYDPIILLIYQPVVILSLVMKIITIFVCILGILIIQKKIGFRQGSFIPRQYLPSEVWQTSVNQIPQHTILKKFAKISFPVTLLLLYSIGILSAILTNIIQNRGKFRIDELVILQWLVCLLIGYQTLVSVRLVMKIWCLEDHLDISNTRSHGIAVGVRIVTGANVGRSEVGRVVVPEDGEENERRGVCRNDSVSTLVENGQNRSARIGTSVTEVRVNVGREVD